MLIHSAVWVMYVRICIHVHMYVTSHQVRSLTLDTLNAAALAKLKDIGNVRSNQIFEACLPEDFDKGLSTILTNILLYILRIAIVDVTCCIVLCTVSVHTCSCTECGVL